MADTCIVCLGDLASHNLLEVPESVVKLEGQQDGVNIHPVDPPDDILDHHLQDLRNTQATEGLVAHLLPCGHNLHDECLRPWVERANSCPICRANFNTVELSAKIGGPILSSYTVHDKQQVADIDPFMHIDDVDVDDDLFDANIQPCMVCEDFGDESTLLLCDGCDRSCHTACDGLAGVPSGAWFCRECHEDDQVRTDVRRVSSPARQRTAAVQNRHGPPRAQRHNAWARVWQTVWSSLHLDLDFPFDDEEQPDQRTDAERREFQEWQRRFQVAERQGGANRFRDTAATLLDPIMQRTRTGTPKPESQDELRAWNFMEKAREANGDPSSNRRKRKSPTSSPTEPQPEPERKLKRPRTRRAPEPVVPENHPAESSRLRNGNANPPAREQAEAHGGPSFLKSLLQEVEHSPAASADNPVHINHQHPPAYADHTSPPRMSSPEASPVASNRPTSRAITPPPLSLTRQSSPVPMPIPLTSIVSPIYPRVGEYTPYSPGDESYDDRRTRRKRRNTQHSPDTSPHRSSDGSPTRANMSYTTKKEIQRMVSVALKPYYAKQEITKDEYTDINRDVSRMMYDKIGDASGLADHKTRERWQTVVNDEVEQAVKVVKADSALGYRVDASKANYEPIEPSRTPTIMTLPTHPSIAQPHPAS
ncbi:hypothetical protein M501DRAFT_938904 [Patellaria atrata CBS 101060]|uniref:PHD and RING finger domain-containing protein n=1 Tax=Patellaria atrata CBS 101060 TaxID=1346257 RepID=A0A9P4S5Y9_9PEZI|nr:hypothetical protein M501DRAFT_938904 [Patellaria atrata CBS 101060]